MIIWVIPPRAWLLSQSSYLIIGDERDGEESTRHFYGNQNVSSWRPHLSIFSLSHSQSKFSSFYKTEPHPSLTPSFVTNYSPFGDYRNPRAPQRTPCSLPMTRVDSPGVYVALCSDRRRKRAPGCWRTIGLAFGWLPVSCSWLPVSCSWLPVSCSWLPVPCSCLPVSCSWLPVPWSENCLEPFHWTTHSTRLFHLILLSMIIYFSTNSWWPI